MTSFSGHVRIFNVFTQVAYLSVTLMKWIISVDGQPMSQLQSCLVGFFGMDLLRHLVQVLMMISPNQAVRKTFFNLNYRLSLPF